MCLASRLEGPIRLRVDVKALSLCWSSHLDSGFFVLCGSCDCLQICFPPSQGNLSGLDSHQRKVASRMAYLTFSLSSWPLFLRFVESITYSVNTVSLFLIWYFISGKSAQGLPFV